MAVTTAPRFIVMLTLLFLAGCGGEPDTLEQRPDAGPETPTAVLAAPVADSPAAGICVEFDGEVVTITIFPDIPDPRCTIIRPDQILQVVNQRGEDITIRLGQHQAQIGHDESATFDQPFGDYLAPGVHLIEVQPCCGAELWLKGE